MVHYLHHQGQELVERFDASAYITLTHMMDSHDVARDRGDYTTVLSQVQQSALVVAIDSDMLYPPVEQHVLAIHLPNAQLAWLHSPHSHDAFLIDMEALNQLIITFKQATVSLSQPLAVPSDVLKV